MLGFLSKRNNFRVVAILAVRNEKNYIGRCLRHLADQGVHACIIDNDSTDGTSEIIAAFDKSVVLKTVRHPYPGYYDWEGMLRVKQQLAGEINAHWFMHVDADEIPQAPTHGHTLCEAILKVDRHGFNAINFDEFVFVPATDDEHWEGGDYVSGMKHYYFFEPGPQRMVRAWKNRGNLVDIASSGGHDAVFSGRSICPDSFVMRHYITLSRDYLIRKYGTRIFPAHELKKGWHYNRVELEPELIRMPERSLLNTYQNDGVWDKSHPWREHFFTPEKHRKFKSC